MHELAITEGLIDLVLDHAKRAGGGTVTQVHLVVGELSRVVDDSVQFYWDILSRETAAAGARLHFRHVPLRFACRDCRSEFEPAKECFVCPSCKGWRLEVVAGDEFRLEALDIEPTLEKAAAPGASRQQGPRGLASDSNLQQGADDT